MKLAALIQYKGTDYSGFQRQNNAPSIQEVIEDALHIITQEDCKINYAGRTDAGVHALSQTFDFTTNIERDCKDWIKGLNSNLPNSLLVTQIIKVDDDFHSRFSALARSYTCCIYNSNQKPIFFADYVHWEKRKIDITKVQNQITAFKGEHDFSGFKPKLKNHFGEKDAAASAAELNYIFMGREKTIEQLEYDVIPEEFEDIIIHKVVALFKDGGKSLYEELTSGYINTDKPIYKLNPDSQVTLNFEKIAKKCQNHIENFEINVFGKEIVGEEFEEDVLLHGNQVLATETSPEGITYNVEKSGDLPSDAAAREEIMADRIQDLDEKVTKGAIVRYEIEEFNDRTVVKTYFRILEDYEKTFNVSNIL